MISPVVTVAVPRFATTMPAAMLDSDAASATSPPPMMPSDNAATTVSPAPETSNTSRAAVGRCTAEPPGPITDMPSLPRGYHQIIANLLLQNEARTCRDLFVRRAFRAAGRLQFETVGSDEGWRPYILRNPSTWDRR